MSIIKCFFFNEGFPKATVVHIRVTLGNLKVIIGYFFTELHNYLKVS